MTNKRIILCGCAASGKDYARLIFGNKSFVCSVSYTTRPPRNTEMHGIDYFFITEEEFITMIDQDKFYEYVEFNGWYYGTTNKQFYNDDVFIMTPHGISLIKPEDRKTSVIIFFDIDEKIRKSRLELRSDADTVDRRLNADAQDFKDFTDFDIKITNEKF